MKKKPTGTGLVIYQYMKEHFMTQEEFGALLEKHGQRATQSNISDWLYNGVPPRRVTQISAATGIPVTDLLD